MAPLGLSSRTKKPPATSRLIADRVALAQHWMMATAGSLRSHCSMRDHGAEEERAQHPLYSIRCFGDAQHPPSPAVSAGLPQTDLDRLCVTEEVPEESVTLTPFSSMKSDDHDDSLLLLDCSRSDENGVPSTKPAKLSL
mmetsp:Transcript_36041/g.84518  ORF Transcript_36041/g.84518 Transcript_36041/m.84518 type:complete len:139 (-) Transcript_36041:31-447(-)